MPFMEWINRIFPYRRSRLELLSVQLAVLNERLKKLEDGNAPPVPLVIHHADRVIVEKADFSNHLGTLNIESLEGRLNIGLNAFGPLKTDELISSAPANPEKQAPKTNIRARKKEDPPPKP